MITHAEINERNRAFWEARYQLINKLMDNKHVMAAVVNREKRRAAYARLTLAYRDPMEQLRHQKSLESELEEIAFELEPLMSLVEAQRKRAQKPRGRVGNDGETLDEIIRELALKPAYRDLKAKALWPLLFSELDRHTSVAAYESHPDIRKWHYKYDFNGHIKAITFGRFASIVAEARHSRNHDSRAE